jgi:N-methylhydantoinase A
MGGTSFDASLIVDGLPSSSNEAELEGLPIQMSNVDIHVIGAGGGSIAWEEAKAVRVGPRSAGSVPGPACYGRGGVEPTVSDANLVLGRIDGANFAGGTLNLDYGKAVASVRSIGDHFGLSAQAMAQGIVDIINAKMADAIRTITVRRGIDPRDFALVAYGGAGPAQAAALADQLDIGEVIVPVLPGAFSAWGMLHTDIRYDFKSTFYNFWDRTTPETLGEEFSRLDAEARAFLAKDGVAPEAMSFEHHGDFRYQGQEYVLTIPMAGKPVDVAAVRKAFDEAYDRQYGHSSPQDRVEIVNLRVAAIGRLARPPAPEPAVAPRQADRVRKVYFGAHEMDTAIIQRDQIPPGQIVSGPAVIEEPTATTLLPPDWQLRVIPGGHLSLTRKTALGLHA